MVCYFIVPAIAQIVNHSQLLKIGVCRAGAVCEVVVAFLYLRCVHMLSTCFDSFR